MIVFSSVFINISVIYIFIEETRLFSNLFATFIISIIVVQFYLLKNGEMGNALCVYDKKPKVPSAEYQ